MRFRTELLWSLAVQGFGAAGVFGAVIVIGSTLGPEAQGLFSRVKTEIEFITTLALFGMPQAVFYFVKSNRMSRPAAVTLTTRLGCISLCASLTYALLIHPADSLFLACFVAASAILVAHAMLRGLVLAQASTRLFNAVTAAPQVVLFLLVLTVVAGGWLESWTVAAVFLLAFLVGGALSWRILHGTTSSSPTNATTSVGPRELLAYGAAAWSVAALNASAALLWVRHTEATLGLAAVGIFTMGLTLVQVILTPFNYAAPLLFKRWMELPTPFKVTRSALLSGLVVLVIIAIALGIQQLLPIPASLAAYGALRDLRWAFAAAAVAEVMVRVAAPGAYAAGHPWAPALSELVRLALLGAAVVFGHARELTSIAWLWAAAATLSAAILLATVRRAGTTRG